MGLLLLSACVPATEKDKINDLAVCGVLSIPISNHMNAIIDNGEKMIGVGADEVIVTGDELSVVYETAC